MASPVADGGCSPVPIANEGRTPAEAVEAVVGVAVQEGVMEVGAVASVQEPAEEEPEEDEEVLEPDEEAEEDPDEDPEEEEEDEEDVREKAEEASDEEAVLMPGEVQEEEDGSEEIEEEEEDEEPSEVDEDSEVDGEECEETKNGVEAGVSEDGAKGLVHESAADDVNDNIEGEQVKRGDKNKDELTDILSNDDGAGGSRTDDMQNYSELAGGLEILVDELPKNCVEEDIAMAFSECGEIKSIRIIRNSSTVKSKDIAFVCFPSIEAADKSLTKLKKGIEVKGIKVRVSPCRDNNTLFLGNICKSWTQDQVLTALNNIGIQECKLRLLSNYKGKNRGFAFLEFESHYYARAAFCRLTKPDAIFGIDRSVTVSFYQNPPKPSDDLMEAKRVYLEHVPLSWNEDNIKECCEEYGKILNVDLFQISKNVKSETFSFVEFSSSNSALTCVEGINNANIVAGSFKLSACLAWLKNGATSEGATTSKKENDHTEKVCVNKNSLQKLPKGNNNGKLTSQAKEVVVKKNAPSKLLNDNGRNITSQDAAKVQQRSRPSEGRKLGKNKNAPINQRPLKKARSNRNVKQPNRTRGTGQSAGPQYSQAHHSLGGSSRSKAYTSDLEPHAGYVPPANQVHITQSYDQLRIGRYGYDIHLKDIRPYATETAPSRSTYSDYTSHARFPAGYEHINSLPPTSGSYRAGRAPFARRGDY